MFLNMFILLAKLNMFADADPKMQPQFPITPCGPLLTRAGLKEVRRLRLLFLRVDEHFNKSDEKHYEQCQHLNPERLRLNR